MKIAFDDSQPIYTQILTDFKRRLVNGSYKAGEKLPSVRNLAADLGVTPNTLQRAFAELNREGYIRTARNSGRYITEYENKLIALRREMAMKAVMDYLEDMSALGFNLQEACEAVNNYGDELGNIL
jgi:GntR family transcriptional regulator